MSLKQKTISGLYWTLAQQFGSQGIQFIVSIVLARLLMPEEFGLIGMITIFVAIGNILRDSGLSSSLIRTTNPDQDDYSTVFVVNLAGSILLYALLFVTAPWIAGFFNQPVLVAITRITTLSFIINAFSGVQVARLTRIMDFKTQLTVQIPSLIVGSFLGILLAWQGFGVWSLVWMNLVQATISAAQLWIRTGWHPHFRFKKEVFRKHFSFGYRLMLSGLIDTIYQNIYHVVIGRFFAPAQLGFYTRAMTLRQLPVQNISSALKKVTLPMFANIKHDDAKLKWASKKLMKQVIFWLAPVLIGLSVIAEPFFRLVFTEKWLPAVPYFRLLCVAGILYPVHAYNLNILNVKGRSDLFLRLEIIKKVLITIGIALAIPFGIHGLLYAQIVLTVMGFIINSWYSGYFIQYSVKEQLRDIIPIIGLALACAGITWMIDSRLEMYGLNDWVRLGVGVTTYAAAYLGVSYVTAFEPLKDFRALILKR